MLEMYDNLPAININVVDGTMPFSKESMMPVNEGTFKLWNNCIMKEWISI